jgi:hypothetical protein
LNCSRRSENVFARFSPGMWRVRRLVRESGGSVVRFGTVAALLIVMTGCVPLSGGWDVRPLVDHQPQVMRRAGQRLGDTPPYFIPFGDSALLFLCRFSTQSPVSVSLPPSANQRERSAIRVALDGWVNAGLGIRFNEVAGDEVAGDPAMIAIRFAEPASDPGAVEARFVGTGYAVSDCLLEADWELAAVSDGPLSAQLVAATIYLRRSNTDMLGHEILLSGDQLVGAALHELGHALGFPGHVATPNSVMAKSTDTIRRFGRRLREGDGFAAPSLATLYALPSGIVVGSASLSDGQKALFDATAKLARSRGWQGPFVRVGDHSANLNWRDRGAMVRSLDIRSYLAVLRSGQPLTFSVGPPERALLKK